MSENKETMKPCPFCGSRYSRKPRVVLTGLKHRRNEHRVKCDHCGAYGPPPDSLLGPGEPKAVKAWNHRPEEDRLREELDTLRESVNAKYWEGIRADNERLKLRIEELADKATTADMLTNDLTAAREENERLKVANNVIGRSAAKQAMEIGRLSHENEQLRIHPTCEACGKLIDWLGQGDLWCDLLQCHRKADDYCSAHTALNTDEKEG